MKTLHVNLQDKEYCLYPEQNTIQKYGWVFPSEFENRTLFVTGLSGTGKTTFVKKICNKENIPYAGQTFILLKPNPVLHRSAEPDLISLTDLTKKKIIDGHFLFPTDTGRGVAYAHNQPRWDYNFAFGDIKNNLLFEFRQLDPCRIQELIQKRYASGNAFGHTFNPTIEEITTGENLLYQTAHKLFEQGADVYIRRGLNGVPWRFSK